MSSLHNDLNSQNDSVGNPPLGVGASGALYPCLWFDGNAKEAVQFYSEIFQEAQTLNANPMAIMFTLEGTKFMALNGGPMFKPNPSISFFAMCSTEEEINSKWEKLSEGGKVMMGLNKYPWSEKYGWCEDKYGVSWQLMLGQEMEQKIFPSLMFTQNNNGKAGEAIDFYTSLFPDSKSLEISRYEKGEGDTGGNIKHSLTLLNGKLFGAMESSFMHEFTFTEGISLVIPCKDQQEIDHYWDSLTANGGKESNCGWLKDKYGLSWQVIPKNMGELMKEPGKAKRVTEAFMKMKKLDIKILEEA